jgi:hypothetical protein
MHKKTAKELTIMAVCNLKYFGTGQVAQAFFFLSLYIK